MPPPPQYIVPKISVCRFVSEQSMRSTASRFGNPFALSVVIGFRTGVGGEDRNWIQSCSGGGGGGGDDDDDCRPGARSLLREISDLAAPW